MGKETGFLEVDRHDRTYADPAERMKGYKEFVIPLPEDELKSQASRCMNCGIPYCPQWLSGEQYHPGLEPPGL